VRCIDSPSPNHNDRRGRPIDMIVLHYTGMPSGEEALARLRSAEAGVSSHYLVMEEGTTHRLVPDSRRAWHAGRSYWAGETDVNARSIGIEIVNPGHEWGYRPFPAKQIEALAALLQHLLRQYAIPHDRVVGHSDVAPLRKEDPGELFPWELLARRGLAYMPRRLSEVPCLEPGSSKKAQSALATFGYGYWEMDSAAVLRSVQRRFRQRLIDGVLDGETMAIISELSHK